jgi:hypothetical protein
VAAEGELTDQVALQQNARRHDAGSG